MAAYEVTGNAPIVGTDGVTVTSGTVDLDPEVTNIDALIQAGCLKPATAKPKAGTKADDKAQE